MSSHSAIDIIMTPNSYVLLRESISTHRTPSPRSPRRRYPPPSMCEMKHRSTIPPASTCSKMMPPERKAIERHHRPIQEDPNLEFPPEHTEPDDANCNWQLLHQTSGADATAASKMKLAKMRRHRTATTSTAA